MELILTSFGLSHLKRNKEYDKDIFYRMPPVSLSNFAGQAFVPDYAILLLCDRVILDIQSYEKFNSGKYHPAYRETAEVFKALYEEGFIRLEDFDSIVENNYDLLNLMLKHDLKNIEEWVSPYKVSSQAWREFVGSLLELNDQVYNDYVEGHIGDFPENSKEQILNNQYIAHELAYKYEMGNSWDVLRKHNLLAEALKSSKKRRKSEYKKALLDELAVYLASVNANLVVSNTLGVGFHDWYDFAPFYKKNS